MPYLSFATSNNKKKQRLVKRLTAIMTMIASPNPAVLNANGRAKTPVPRKVLKRVNEACKFEDCTNFTPPLKSSGAGVRVGLVTFISTSNDLLP